MTLESLFNLEISKSPTYTCHLTPGFIITEEAEASEWLDILVLS